MARTSTFLALALPWMLGACASVPPSPFASKSDAAKERLEQVVVSVAPDAQIRWANAENAYVSRKKGEAGYKPKHRPVETGTLASSEPGPDSEFAEIMATPEVRAQMREQVSGRLKSALDESVKAFMQGGSRPVRLEVVVKAFVIPSAVERVVVGGAPIVVASAELKDAATGAVIAARPHFAAAAFAGNGLAGVLVDQAMEDLDVRVTQSYAEQYRNWLIPKDAT